MERCARSVGGEDWRFLTGAVDHCSGCMMRGREPEGAITILRRGVPRPTGGSGNALLRWEKLPNYIKRAEWKLGWKRPKRETT